MKIALIIIGIIVVAGVVFFRLFSGEKERIKALFRIYRSGKSKFPEITERELLEIVVEEYISPSTSTTLKNSGISGREYLDRVFESRQLDVDDLIYHIITLEFPKKYKPLQFNIEEIEEQIRTKKISVGDELKLMIKNYHKEFLGEI